MQDLKISQNELNALILVFPGKPSLRCKIILKDFTKKIQSRNEKWAVFGAFTSHEPILETVIDEIVMAMDETQKNVIEILPMFIMPGQISEYDLPKIILEKKKKFGFVDFSLLKPPLLLDELFDVFSEVIENRLKSTQ